MTERRSNELTDWLLVGRELTQLIAHDLRNPLASLVANVSFLEMTAASDADSRELVSDMKLATDALLRLIEQMQSISRLEASSAIEPAESRVFDVGEAFRAVIDRTEPQRQTAAVEITLEATPGARIAGDRGLFEQLALILVTNVVNHVRRGDRARVTIRSDERTVTVTLDDNGPPFGPVERDFSRDGQLELKSRSDSRYARGLGLYLVGMTTRAMRGTIDTSSETRRGHLALTFPRAP